jgi:hypothetical protein
LGVGAIRGKIENEYKDQSHDNSSLINNLAQGSGLDGVTSVVHHFSSTNNFFYGKTYLDMLLLPIPRSIYTSKPEWYGVDDISRLMGWPESTQSAITLPGEAFANFGWLGLLMAPLYGVLLYFISKKLYAIGGSWFFWYISVGVSTLSVANWMAFTGIMNQLSTSVMIFLFCKIFMKNNANYDYLN